MEQLNSVDEKIQLKARAYLLNRMDADERSTFETLLLEDTGLNRSVESLEARILAGTYIPSLRKNRMYLLYATLFIGGIALGGSTILLI